MNGFRPQTRCGCWFVGQFTTTDWFVVAAYRAPDGQIHRTQLCARHAHLSLEAAYREVLAEIAAARQRRNAGVA